MGRGKPFVSREGDVDVCRMGWGEEIPVASL